MQRPCHRFPMAENLPEKYDFRIQNIYSGGDFSIQAKIPARVAGTYGKLDRNSTEGKALEMIYIDKIRNVFSKSRLMGFSFLIALEKGT
jgi:hypothetical protein